MHLKYFGDSYDIVKRFLLSTLSPLGPWSVHPMFVDAVEPDAAREFTTLIGAPLCTKTLVGTAADRIESLAGCKAVHHLLLDPDTGLKMLDAPNKPSPAHLYANELAEIVNARPSFLTAVYDQSLLRASRPPQLKQKLKHFGKQGIDGFAYESHASFLFLSRDKKLLERATEALHSAGLPALRLIRSA